MADQKQIVKVNKSDNNCLKPLLNNVLEVLNPDIITLMSKSWRILPIDVAIFTTFFQKIKFT